MNAVCPNSVSIPRREFNETYQVLKVLLDQNKDPEDLLVEDPFLSVKPVKVDLRRHMENLFERMSKVKETIDASTRIVTIDFG